MKVGRYPYCLEHGEPRAMRAIDLDHGLAVVLALFGLGLFLGGVGSLAGHSGLAGVFAAVAALPCLLLAHHLNRRASTRLVAMQAIAWRERQGSGSSRPS